MQQTFTALVADDHEMICHYVREVMRKRGYEVRVASDGAEALEMFRQQPCDLLVTDINMPRMNGMELLRQVRALDEHVGVILMTGNWTERDRVEAQKLGAAFIAKPFAMAPFNHLIDQMEENRALRLAEHPSAQDDRRKDSRVSVHLPTAFMMPANSTADVRFCEILDISLGGSRSRFVLTSPFPAGTEVNIYFASMATHGEVCFTAVVVWADSASQNCGAQFRDLDERQRLVLESVVAEDSRRRGG